MAIIMSNNSSKFFTISVKLSMEATSKTKLK